MKGDNAGVIVQLAFWNACDLYMAAGQVHRQDDAGPCSVHLVGLSGVLRGCGRQKMGAYINLAAYYLVGNPVAFVCAFVFHLGGMGLWFGILSGLLVQVLLLLSITLCTNWDKEALLAKDRVFRSALPEGTNTRLPSRVE